MASGNTEVATIPIAGRLRRLARCCGYRSKQASELRRGRELIAAIDAGGIPLNPARVNQIARDLGLEVSTSAAMAETIERIRAAVDRGTGGT